MKIVKANKILIGSKEIIKIDKESLINNLKNAVCMAKIILYAQAFTLKKEASIINDWNLNYENIV